MAITPSFAQVAPDSSGKKIDNVHLVNPDADEVERQVTATGDPETWAALQRVRNSLPGSTDYGAVVRQPAPAFDSGIVTLEDAAAVATADTVRARSLLLCNLTQTQKLVTITNTAGDFYLKDFPLEGQMTVTIPLGDVTMVGVKWHAGDADSVNAQLVGDK